MSSMPPMAMSTTSNTQAHAYALPSACSQPPHSPLCVACTFTGAKAPVMPDHSVLPEHASKVVSVHSQGAKCAPAGIRTRVACVGGTHDTPTLLTHCALSTSLLFILPRLLPLIRPLTLTTHASVLSCGERHSHSARVEHSSWH